MSVPLLAYTALLRVILVYKQGTVRRRNDMSPLTATGRGHKLPRSILVTSSR